MQRPRHEGEKASEEKLEAVDEKVDRLQVQVAVIDTRVKIGFAVIGTLIAAPKLGGPSVHDALAAAVHLLF